MALVNKSMIARAQDGRYTIHELMRQYAAEKLNLNPQFERESLEKHCHYYLNFLAERRQTLKTAQDFAILRELESEMENEMAAWYYGVDHRLDDLLLSAIYTFVYWYVVRAYIDKLKELTEYAIDKVDGPLFGLVFVGFSFSSPDTHRIHMYADQALPLVNDVNTPVEDVLFLLCMIGLLNRDETLIKHARIIVEAHEDPWLELIVYS